MRRVICFFLIIFFFLYLASCKSKNKDSKTDNKIVVVTTLFPVYDFTKTIGGEYIKAILIPPPGVEPHSFEPKPEDIVTINRADIFIFTGKYMEPWAYELIKGLNKDRPLIIDASTGVNLLKRLENDNHNHKDHQESDIDPHIWLDFDNAKVMVNNILQGLIKISPENSDYFTQRTMLYIKNLTELDNKYRETLEKCENKTIIYGGHYTFGYLAKRYNLKFISAYKGLESDQDPSPQRMVELIRLLKKYNQKYIFYEELINPKIAHTLSEESKGELLKLSGAHNISKDDFEKGITYIQIMEENLISLKKGLNCKEK